MIGNAFFCNISFKLHTSESNLEKSKTMENVENNKVKIKPTFDSLEMKLLKSEYIFSAENNGGQQSTAFVTAEELHWMVTMTANI